MMRRTLFLMKKLEGRHEQVVNEEERNLEQRDESTDIQIYDLLSSLKKLEVSEKKEKARGIDPQGKRHKTR